MSFSLPDSILLRRDLLKVRNSLITSVAENLETDTIVAGSAQLQSLVQTNRTVFDSAGLRGIEQGIATILDSAPVFDLIFAASPHDTFLLEVGRWFRSSIHQDSLFKISVRRSLAGGMVLRSKNRIFDFSLRPKIIENKQKIPEVVKNV